MRTSLPWLLALLVVASVLAPPALASEHDDGADGRGRGRGGEDDNPRNGTSPPVASGSRPAPSRADCEEHEVETEREERHPNGTRYRERVRERTVDCPGEPPQRHELSRRGEWREEGWRPHGADQRARVDIRRDEGDVRVRVELPATANAPGFDLEMRRNASVYTLRETGRTAAAAEIAFLEVLEFEDRNGDGAFDLDDAVVRRWSVAGLDTTVEDDGEVLAVRHALPGGGTLSFVHHDIAAGRAKFDVVIESFAYETETSQLALRAAFHGEHARFRSDLRHPALVSGSEDRLAAFDWVPTVDVDGVEAPVLATVYVGGAAAAGSAQLYLSYPRGDVIRHDPSVGFLTVQSAVAVVEALVHPAAYAIAASAAGAFLAVGYMARRRR